MRLMFFDERSFQDESFDFVVGDDDFDVGDLVDQRVGLDAVAEIAAAAGLKIRAHAVAQVLGLADIDHFSRRVFVQIDAGRRAEFL